MAWSTPVIHATGDVVTASDWNVSSNDLLYLYQRPQFQVHAATGPSIGNGVATTIAYDTVDEDTFAGWNSGTHVYTIPAGEGGMWLFSVTMQWTPNGTGVRAVEILGITGSPFNFLAASTDSVGRQFGAMAFIATAGIGISVAAYQTSGGALSLVNGTCFFSGVRVG